MAIGDILLILTATIFLTAGIIGIYTLGFDCSHDSKHYRRRAELTNQRLKFALLVDTK